jgi:hypothetical protein
MIRVNGVHFSTDLNDDQVRGLAAYYAQSIQSIVDAYDAESEVHEFGSVDALRIEQAASFLAEMAAGKVIF